MGVGVDKEPRRGESTRQGRSRKQARQNRAMRAALYGAFERLLDDCLRAGWFGDIALRAHVEDGILQREYAVFFERSHRMT